MKKKKKKERKEDCLALKDGTIVRPETSVRKYHPTTLHKIPKDSRSNLHRGGSLTSDRRGDL